MHQWACSGCLVCLPIAKQAMGPWPQPDTHARLHAQGAGWWPRPERRCHQGSRGSHKTLERVCGAGRAEGRPFWGDDCAGATGGQVRGGGCVCCLYAARLYMGHVLGMGHVRGGGPVGWVRQAVCASTEAMWVSTIWDPWRWEVSPGLCACIGEHLKTAGTKFNLMSA